MEMRPCYTYSVISGPRIRMASFHQAVQVCCGTRRAICMGPPTMGGLRNPEWCSSSHRGNDGRRKHRRIYSQPEGLVHHFEEEHPRLSQVGERRVDVRDFTSEKVTVNDILPQLVDAFELLFIEGVVRA